MWWQKKVRSTGADLDITYLIGPGSKRPGAPGAPMLEALLRAEVSAAGWHRCSAADRLAALPLAPLSEADVEAEIHAGVQKGVPLVRGR